MRYEVGHTHARRLRELARCEPELAAIDRLALFEGTDVDVRVAASVWQRAGETELAAQLVASL